MRYSIYKIIYLGGFLVFVYHEFIVYWFLSLTWLPQPECDGPNCKRLLLVADPQIVGPEWRTSVLMDWISIFDSDRYIRRTFREAMDYVRPDVVVFMGDLMDQGFKATDSEYRTYFNRLENIFGFADRLAEGPEVVLYPGDNDVGGIDEVLVPSSVFRFDKTFNQTGDSTLIDFIEFCKVNLMTSKLQSSKFLGNNVIRVALTHVPLMPKKSYILSQVVKEIRPHLILSGHMHRSLHFVTHENDLWSSQRTSIPPEDPQVREVRFEDGVIHEIIVPTCSYRMGVQDMGYGVAYMVADGPNLKMLYNVLWLPRRFQQLFTYVYIALVVFVIESLRLFHRTMRKSYQRQAAAAAKGSLLRYKV